MANERREVTRVTITGSDGATRSFSVAKKLDQTDTTPAIDDRFIDVGTSESDITFEHVTTQGVICLQNVGANVVEYGPKVGGVMQDFAQIDPGETHKLRLKSGAGAIIRWVALTATTSVRLWAADA